MTTLTATRQQLGKTLHDARHVVFAAVLALGMTLILSFNLVGASQVAATVGQPAPDDVFAPRSLTYTSEVLTTQARQQARESVSEVYTPLDFSIGRAQLAWASSVFKFIDTVRADPLASREEKVASIQAIEGLEIEEGAALDLLELSQQDYEEARDEILSIIDIYMRQEIRESNLSESRAAAQRAASLGLTTAQSNVVTALAPQFIVPTVFADEEATVAAREQAAAAVEPVTRTIAQNQRIIRGGEIVTDADIELLTQFGLLRTEPNWRDVVSIALLSLLFVTVLTLYWRQFYDGLQDTGRYLAVLAGLILFFTLVARTVTAAAGFWPYLFPIAALSMLLAVVYDVRLATLVTLMMAAVLGFIAPGSLDLTLYAAAGGLMAILTLRDAQRVVAFFRAGIVAAAGHIVVLLIVTLPLNPELVPLLQQMLYGLGNGVLSAALTLVGFFALGGLFGIITILQLQDLSRLDHPLLQELLRRAPGTYHHSIMVANLAEQAAERVRANSTLVRVGAFYHDIGKMNRPPFFTENQEGANPHDSLDAYTSARIIISHVTDGLDLAKRYRLPDRIRDFIAEHHGTRLVKGFYHKARTQAGDEADEVDEDQFRYPGPRPRSRESGIVMLADAVEATASALRPNSSAAIEKLVNSIVDDDVMERQLVNSGLTLGDLEKVRASLIESLKGRYHMRVKYPGNEELEIEAPAEMPALPPPQNDSAAVAPSQPAATPVGQERNN